MLKLGLSWIYLWTKKVKKGRIKRGKLKNLKERDKNKKNNWIINEW